MICVRQYVANRVCAYTHEFAMSRLFCEPATLYEPASKWNNNADSIVNNWEFFCWLMKKQYRIEKITNSI